MALEFCYRKNKDKDAAVVLPPMNDRNDVIALKYSGLKTSDLKELLKKRNASLRDKKKDLLER